MSAAAAALLRARRTRPRAPLSTLPEHPRTLEDGAAAQLALAGLVGAVPPAGFKIGAAAPSMQRYLGLAGPAVGFMGEDSLHGSGSALAWQRFFRPGAECELAVQLARDLPGPCDPAAARDAVETVMPAIEIVESRYDDLAAFGAPALIADQVFHAAAILGEPCPTWRDVDWGAIGGVLSVDGTVRGEGHGRDLLGGPFEALAWLAGSAEVRAFGGLRAGQIMMLGSVCTPVWLDRPGRVEVRFEGLAPVAVELFSDAS